MQIIYEKYVCEYMYCRHINLFLRDKEPLHVLVKLRFYVLEIKPCHHVCVCRPKGGNIYLRFTITKGIYLIVFIKVGSILECPYETFVF